VGNRVEREVNVGNRVERKREVNVVKRVDRVRGRSMW
jgi:hypothetical protein